MTDTDDEGKIDERSFYQCLDQGIGSCVFAKPRAAVLVEETLLQRHGEVHLVHAYGLMPNHVHAAVTLDARTGLRAFMQALKGRTAWYVNERIGRRGRLWQSDDFDRAVRDERHFISTASYCEANPVRAGLCRVPENNRFSSARPRIAQTLRAAEQGRGEGIRAGKERLTGLTAA